ncbi:hypothetical protein M5K25_022491 [Dendrobium thyrsiflorum]|uniref:Pentatricopeptide repeat-containing protein n=1 Tax=Dendrobium thyrsiflorum TaxID=117978 RepID=A0ABD0U6B1_DENTH
MVFRDVFTWSSMVDGYWKNEMVLEARQAFEAMPVKNVVSWTAMIQGYAKIGDLEEGETRGRRRSTLLVAWKRWRWGQKGSSEQATGSVPALASNETERGFSLGVARSREEDGLGVLAPGVCEHRKEKRRELGLLRLASANKERDPEGEGDIVRDKASEGEGSCELEEMGANAEAKSRLELFPSSPQGSRSVSREEKHTKGTGHVRFFLQPASFPKLGPKARGEEEKRRGERRNSSSTTAGIPPDRHLTLEFCRTVALRRSFAGSPPDAGVWPDRHQTPEFRRSSSTERRSCNRLPIEFESRLYKLDLTGQYDWFNFELVTRPIQSTLKITSASNRTELVRTGEPASSIIMFLNN